MIDRRCPDIVSRWLDRVASELGFEEMEQSELRDAIPDFLEALADMLCRGVDPQDDSAGLWSRVAAEHAVTRIRQGFDVDAVLREFVLLRRVITEIAHEEGLGDVPTTQLITESIEAAIAESVRNYVESRDASARRAEAEHVAFVTHELRNPLGTAVLGVTQLAETLGLDEATRRVVGIIERAHCKLQTLIDEVLTVERGRAGEIKPAPERIALGEIVEEAVAPTRELARRRGFALEVAVDRDTELRIDRRLTVSAVQNLVDNAIKYSVEGPVQVWTACEDDGVSIHVRDRCGGMPAEELVSLFAPFQRGRHQGRGAGTGLGLSIVRQAVEAQGGTAHAEPADGGCHFWIELPMEAAETEAS